MKKLSAMLVICSFMMSILFTSCKTNSLVTTGKNYHPKSKKVKLTFCPKMCYALQKAK